MNYPSLPTFLKCIRCQAAVKKVEVMTGHAEGIDDKTCVCAKCLPRWKELQARRQDRPLLAEDENFIALMQAAAEDTTIRQKILAIARLDPFNRESLLNTYLQALMLKGAPEKLLNILSFLKDDDIAHKVREVLES